MKIPTHWYQIWNTLIFEILNWVLHKIETRFDEIFCNEETNKYLHFWNIFQILPNKYFSGNWKELE